MIYLRKNRDFQGEMGVSFLRGRVNFGDKKGPKMARHSEMGSDMAVRPGTSDDDPWVSGGHLAGISTTVILKYASPTGGFQGRRQILRFYLKI